MTAGGQASFGSGRATLGRRKNERSRDANVGTALAEGPRSAGGGALRACRPRSSSALEEVPMRALSSFLVVMTVVACGASAERTDLRAAAEASADAGPAPAEATEADQLEI